MASTAERIDSLVEQLAAEFERARVADPSLEKALTDARRELDSAIAALHEVAAEVRDREVGEIAAKRRAHGVVETISGDELIDDLGVERSKI